jgi:hypothetical protein
MDVDDRRERDVRRFVENLEDMVTSTRAGDPLPGLDGIDGTDASGTVSCVVDLGGGLSRVGITDGWWQAVGPHGVAAAVLQALRFARDKAGLARMVLARHGRPYTTAALDYHTLFTDEPPHDLPPYDAPDFADALLRKVNRAAAVLDNAQRFARERDGGGRREVTGPRGLFRVVLVGVTVVGALVNEPGLRALDADELAADARDALLAARPSFVRHGER